MLTANISFDLVVHSRCAVCSFFRLSLPLLANPFGKHFPLFTNYEEIIHLLSVVPLRHDLLTDLHPGFPERLVQLRQRKHQRGRHRPVNKAVLDGSDEVDLAP
jgi:hypothetical protein